MTNREAMRLKEELEAMGIIVEIRGKGETHRDNAKSHNCGMPDWSGNSNRHAR